ncbi:MAG: hypothetical protein H6Q89_4671 [Myxococcaceae bacterium]|nr:hypothetical protein [Myxococcaceae bacterium]
MKRLSLLSCCVAALLAVPAVAEDRIAAPAEGPEPKIQLAILIDTSSSMDGLINQTREQLWKIVNTFATAKKNGKRPRFELALYEYGNDSLSREGNFIRMVSPLTTDLDKVSEQLHKLRTNGGDEYCGAVISKAVTQLEWSKSKGDLKLIYIAGNEPFSQGPVNYVTAVKNAIEHGIVVNTIHAGDQGSGISGKWKDAAMLADGNFLTIDQNRAIAHVAAPQDAEIARLGNELNKTYVAYGDDAPAAVARQEAQDKAAMGMSMGSGTARAVTKSSANYKNSNWDLVDAKKDGADVAKMPAAALPAPMRAMKPAERVEFVEKKAKERTEIQEKISRLNTEREQFVKAEEKKSTGKKEATLDSALLESAKAQGAKADFAF